MTSKSPKVKFSTREAVALYVMGNLYSLIFEAQVSFPPFAKPADEKLSLDIFLRQYLMKTPFVMTLFDGRLINSMVNTRKGYYILRSNVLSCGTLTL